MTREQKWQLYVETLGSLARRGAFDDWRSSAARQDYIKAALCVVEDATRAFEKRFPHPPATPLPSAPGPWSQR